MPSVLHYILCVDEIQARHAGVKDAIMKAHSADQLESVGDYNKALDCYKDAVEILIPLIEGSLFSSVYICISLLWLPHPQALPPSHK